MYGSSVAALPVTGAGSTALVAAMNGHVIVALVLASICAFMTGILMLQQPEEEPDDVI
jgi:hypothetical protein